MNWDKIAETIIRYYSSNRAVGHTNAMLDGGRNTPGALVMTAVHNQGEAYKIPRDNRVTLATAEQDRLKGFNRPLLIDHHVTVLILVGLLDELETLRRDNAKLREETEA